MQRKRSRLRTNPPQPPRPPSAGTATAATAPPAPPAAPPPAPVGTAASIAICPQDITAPAIYRDMPIAHRWTHHISRYVEYHHTHHVSRYASRTLPYPPYIAICPQDITAPAIYHDMPVERHHTRHISRYACRTLLDLPYIAICPQDITIPTIYRDMPTGHHHTRHILRRCVMSDALRYPACRDMAQYLAYIATRGAMCDS